jgi:hypothetical protein
MITFRDGPTGRRAGLITDPDVWEIVMWIDDVSGLKDPAKTLAQEGVVTRAQTDAALRYRAAYPEEMGPRDQRDSMAYFGRWLMPLTTKRVEPLTSG